jgi:hypothetical protein
MFGYSHYAIHNTSAQNLSKINAMINPLVVESLTVNDTTRRRNILSKGVHDVWLLTLQY